MKTLTVIVLILHLVSIAGCINTQSITDNANAQCKVACNNPPVSYRQVVLAHQQHHYQ